MNIIVCIKQVPSTEANVRIGSSGVSIDETNLVYIINPYDEFGVEEALRIKERLGEGDVTVITLGHDRAAEALRGCLAMGADKAIHIKDDVPTGYDSFCAAMVLSKVIMTLSYDIILCGKQAIDDDNGCVGIQIAEFLSIPHVSVINGLEIDGKSNRAVAHRQIEMGIEVVECHLPAVFTCQKGLNEPRYPTLPNIMKAKRKPLVGFGLEATGLKKEDIGTWGPRTQILRLEERPKRKQGKIIDGESEELIKDLVRLLREEAKVI